MNEQPFADPANPPKPDLTSREKLTKQIEDLQQLAAKAIAENNPKGAVIALQQQLVLSYLLMTDELQAMQQMFERVDRRLDQVEKRLIRPEVPKPPPLSEDNPLTPEQRGAFELLYEALAGFSKQDSMFGMGCGLLVGALAEFRNTFLKPKGG